MPWLTPDSIPEEDDCRPLLIPASSAWLALVSGALTELTKPYNWQKFGTLTVQETVDEMQAIVDYYYSAPCATCVTPGGYRVTRISPEGHLQQLNSDGSWEDATGDYAIPTPAARTEGTVPDQNCLAAKNATNVLSQLYESLSESFASELSTDEAITAFIAAAVAVIGFEFAPITWSIAAIGFVFFEALFKALEYITADLWTEDFSIQFECLLLSCVINTAGVVTFDWDCVNAKLEAQVNDRGMSEVQMRLYVQIGYILFFIGGADGLNLAGRTTDITNDDCSVCHPAWCRLSDFRGATDGWTIGEAGTFESYGVRGGVFDANNAEDVQIIRMFTATEITSVEILYARNGASGANEGVFVQLYLSSVLQYSYTASGTTTNPGTWPTADLISGPSGLTVTADEIRVQLNDGTSGASCYIQSVTTNGNGTNPLGGDNC